MGSRYPAALLLVGIMLVSGCLGMFSSEEGQLIDEGGIEVPNQPPILVLDSTQWVADYEQVLAITGVVEDELLLDVDVEVILMDTDGNLILPVEIATSVDASGGLMVAMVLDRPGQHEILITLRDFHGVTSESFGGIITINPPPEPAPAITTLSIIEFDEPDFVTIVGGISHDYLHTCNVSAVQFSGEEVSAIPDGQTGAFSIPLGLIEETTNLTVNATCGMWTIHSNEHFVLLIISSSGDDSDGDGIEDELDNCPDGMGEDDGWQSTPASDKDGDGCHDAFEDTDDDNDGILDSLDRCPQTPGWISTPALDHDSDGCNDADEDDDDDGDGVLDLDDSCPLGQANWPSTLFSDWDGDGCRDLDEDFDDDADGYNDSVDSCPSGGPSNWIPDEVNDWDGDGCRDADEDIDDDNDGVNDLNNTGETLDQCPFTAIGSVDVDANGCAPYQRDSDGDGVSDDLDQCEGTPLGNSVNSVGCADLDGDGVFSNVDNCPDSPIRWSVDALGCAVIQTPVAWNTGPYGSGRLDVVSSFSVPTLSGNTWNFQNEWTGEDVYLFLFKYTDGSGNSNNAIWSHNPRDIILNLPDNTHLFYGSFDSSYHNDVISRKSDVLTKLNSAEEEKWMPRIHFIDQQAGNINGGLGALISGWGHLYYGIDRFQQSREIGSLHDWSQGGSCCTQPKHLAFEPQAWNYEFPTTMRKSDPGVTEVQVFTGEWHNGGWGGGYNSFVNATFPNASQMSAYDTMEVYAYNPCSEHRQRHSSGGCHEWDYLHYLKICDYDNSSNCGTEFVRYITTYGREGRWLTDITPFMWMLSEGGERRFQYSGANGMGLEISVLLSNWGEVDVSSSAEYAFSGGQFAGDYNNESRYKRAHLFTPPNGTDRVEIVAVITGHGFNQDTANCAEFCNHEHHYYIGNNHAFEQHPLVGNNLGCTTLVNRGVAANQFGSWPYGRGGWCPGQDVEQWTFDITNWVDLGGVNNLTYRGLYNGQEYVPNNTNGGDRNIRAAIWLVYYNATGSAIGSSSTHSPPPPPANLFENSCGPHGSVDSGCAQHILSQRMIDNSFGTMSATY